MAAEMVPATIDLQQIDGQAWTTSLVVAEKFGKRHDNVMQAIGRLECSPEFHALNFQEMTIAVEVGNGAVRHSPAYRMTRDGFVFLAMGFTGREAAAWKERFIAAFNAMESTLRSAVTDQQDWMRRILESNERNLRVLSDVAAATRSELATVNTRVDEIAEAQKRVSADIFDIKSRLRLRAKPSNPVRDELYYAMQRRGWRCPCCEQPVTRETSEIDHFFDVGRANRADLWVLCKPCHAGLSTGRTQRHEVRSRFEAFQEFARGSSPQRALDFGG